MAKKAKATLQRDQVPAIPEGIEAEAAPNGDLVYEDGDRRWRTNGEGEIKYYFRTMPGADRSVFPYEEMYRG